MKKIKLVEVIWEDAWSAFAVSGEPDEIVELMPPLIRRSTGYLVAKDEEKVILARDHDPKFVGPRDAYADCARIPRVLVRKITELSPRVPAPRKPRRKKEPDLPPSLPKPVGRDDEFISTVMFNSPETD